MQPILVPIPLAPNPKSALKYSLRLKLKNGEPIELADPRATRGLLALMDMAAVMGGAACHWGGPSAFADLMSAIYAYAFWASDREKVAYFEKFHIVNDAGHCENGIYALKALYGYADLSVQSLKGFRSIQSPLSGHGEAHLFPQGVYISNGPLGSGLPQAQGLAFADRLAGKSRVTVVTISDGACFEGEAKEAFAAIAGFAKKDKMAPFICVISDNNTKLSGRIDEQAFSMQESFNSLSHQGWKVLKLERGNDLSACLRTFEEAVLLATANPQQPVVIHAKTIKGIGVKKTAESASGGHGFPLSDPQDLEPFLKEIYSGSEVPSEFTAWLNELLAQKASKPSMNAPTTDNPNEKVQVGIAKAMIEKRKAGLPIISISSDLPGSTGTAGFQKEFPAASVDVGVAEANMVSMATGLSKAGYIPVVDTFAQFGVTKGALPLIMSSLSEGPLIAIFSHTGFQDAADGASHQALSYFSMVSSIPNVDVHCLTSSEEAYHLLGQAFEQFAQARRQGVLPRTQVFFLGREDFPRRLLAADHKYQLGQAQILKDTTSGMKSSVAIAAAGSLVPQALLAAEQLQAQGVGAIVVNPSLINRPDIATWQKVLQRTQGRLVTVEDHQLIAGMGAILVHALNLSGISLKVASLGVKDEFGQSAYKALHLYQKHGLDAGAIVTAASRLG